MTATAPAVLRARPHLHCAPVDGGVYVDGARGRFVLRGWDGLYAVVDRCLPLLERGAGEDELVVALGTERARPVVRRLVGELRDHGMLLDAGDAVTAPVAERARFGETVAHLEAHAASPSAAFTTVRAARVALVGPAELTGPAARALERAGIGEVLVGDDVPAGVDAVLSCPADDEPLRPPGTAALVVPVRLDRHAYVVGPVVTGEDTGVADALGHRVRAAAGTTDRPLGPNHRALAGALAGHLLFELLAGLADETVAHVVYGTELAADRVTVTRPGGRAVRVTLGDGPADAAPESDAAPDVGELHAPWTGVFALSDDEPGLPSLPLVVRAARRRAAPSEQVLAWEAGRWYSTVALALDVLRRQAADVDPGTVGAAGTTRDTWLLDGALRLLAPRARPLPDPAGDGAVVADPERERLGRNLSALGGDTWSVSVHGVTGVPWRLARVTRTGTGVVLGAAWAPEADAAVRDALSTAVARAQAVAYGGRRTVALLSTPSLMRAGSPAVRELHDAVVDHLAGHGMRLTGCRLPDPVLGELPLHHGPVSIESVGSQGGRS